MRLECSNFFNVSNQLYRVVRIDSGEVIATGLSKEVADQVAQTSPATYRAEVIDSNKPSEESEQCLDPQGQYTSGSVTGNTSPFNRDNEARAGADTITKERKTYHPVIMAAITVGFCLLLIPLFKEVLFPLIAAIIWYGVPLLIIGAVGCFVWVKFGARY